MADALPIADRAPADALTARARDGGQDTTREALFRAAELLVAEHGFAQATVREIAAAAGANVAALNYHFGSKDALLFEIFRRRTSDLNKERTALLKQVVANGATPTVRNILHALFAPPTLWLFAGDERRTAIRFVQRARVEGSEPMRRALHSSVAHLAPFADALSKALPHLAAQTLYLKLHFCLGLVHQNRPAEFERLGMLSAGTTEDLTGDTVLDEMLDFAAAGFLAEAAPGVPGGINPFALKPR